MPRRSAWVTVLDGGRCVAGMIESKGPEYILPVTIDDRELPGVQPTTGYLSLKEISIDEVERDTDSEAQHVGANAGWLQFSTRLAMKASSSAT